MQTFHIHSEAPWYAYVHLLSNYLLSNGKNTFNFFLTLEDLGHFVAPRIPMFWTSGDVCTGFQSQGGSPHITCMQWIPQIDLPGVLIWVHFWLFFGFHCNIITARVAKRAKVMFLQASVIL